jgi:hypothetical protein
MASISPEFMHNPLLCLVPVAGDVKHLGSLLPVIKDRISELNLSLEQASDEKLKRMLLAEQDMLNIVIDWMSLETD